MREGVCSARECAVHAVRLGVGPLIREDIGLTTGESRGVSDPCVNMMELSGLAEHATISRVMLVLILGHV